MFHHHIPAVIQVLAGTSPRGTVMWFKYSDEAGGSQKNQSAATQRPTRGLQLQRISRRTSEHGVLRFSMTVSLGLVYPGSERRARPGCFVPPHPNPNPLPPRPYQTPRWGGKLGVIQRSL